MAWFRLDDVFHAHPKVLAAGNAAVGLWVRAATYSAAYELDGRVPAHVAEGYAGRPREIELLTESGLWLPNGHGFVIRDFLQYNPAADNGERRAERLEAKRRGGEARAAHAERDEHGHFLPRTPA